MKSCLETDRLYREMFLRLWLLQDWPGRAGHLDRGILNDPKDWSGFDNPGYIVDLVKREVEYVWRR